MGWIAKLVGIIGATLQLDAVNAGPKWKNNGGVVEFRNAADSDYVVVRGDGSTTGAKDLRPWESFAKSYYVDPAAGNNANPGTQAQPFLTWNGGAWPAIRQLLYCDVTVNTVGATVDTSMTGSYIIPVGVNLSIQGTWGDSGLGQLTVGAGSTTTSLVVSGGGLTVNQWSGARVRFSAGAMIGQSYEIMQNAAGTITPIAAGFASAPAQNDTFFIERPQGGYTPAASTKFDSSSNGAGFNILGSVIRLTNGNFTWSGKGGCSGLEIDGSGTGNNFILNGGTGTIRMGQLHGDPVNLVEGLGSANNLGVYVHDGSGTSPTIAVNDCTTMFLGLVQKEAGTSVNGFSTVVLNNLELHGTTGRVFFRTLVGPNVVQLQNIHQVGAGTTVPLEFQAAASVNVNVAVFDATLTVDCMTLTGGSWGRFTSCTGGNAAAAGKFGLVVTNGCRVINNGSNTCVGGAGAISLGAHAAQAVWPAAGTLVTDLADANSQGCVQA